MRDGAVVLLSICMIVITICVLSIALDIHNGSVLIITPDGTEQPTKWVPKHKQPIALNSIIKVQEER